MSHCAPEATLKPKRWVHAVNCYNWCLRRASVLGGCSKDVARRQQSFCRQMCCASMEQHTICRWTSGVDVLDLLKPSVCRQPSTEVRGRTKTSKRNMPAWSRHVSGLTKNRRNKQTDRDRQSDRQMLMMLQSDHCLLWDTRALRVYPTVYSGLTNITHDRCKLWMCPLKCEQARREWQSE